MQTAEEFWRGHSDLDVLELPEGESLANTKAERLTAERLDALALYWSTPDEVRATWTGPKDYRDLALAVGCRLASIPKWQLHPKMGERIGEYITAAARLSMANILYGQIIAAGPHVEIDRDGRQVMVPGDTKAANFVGTIAKQIRTGGVLNVNQNNIAPEPENKLTDEEIDLRIARFHSKAEEHGEAA